MTGADRWSTAPVVHWFLPTGGDGRTLGQGVHGTGIGGRQSGGPGRAASLAYLTQVATAAEELGFSGVLTPTGAHCQDPWVVTSSLLAATRRLRFLVAVRPGLVAPLLTAQMATTFQALSGNRLILNVVVGGDPVEQLAYGDRVEHDERYARAEEFLEVLRTAWTGEPFDHRGRWYEVEGGRLGVSGQSFPPVYLGGASDAAVGLAARAVDVQLTWAERVEDVARHVRRLREAAGGRPLRAGIRAHVIARADEEQAWAAAGRLLDGVDDATVAQAQQRLARLDSVGQRRMLDLHRGDRDRLVVGPNLWAGAGLVRGGAALTLVGSYAQVAERLCEYREAGVDEFVLSGYPHLEEVYEVGEGVLPLLRAA